MRLRPATTDDAERVHALVRDAYGMYVERIGREVRPMQEDYAQVIADRDVTVAERDGELVGVVVLARETMDELHADGDGAGFVVDNVAVDPAVKGTGVGRSLLEHAEAEARRAGEDTVYLYTHELMTENIALYGRIGYVEYTRWDYGGGELVYLRKSL